MTRSEHDADLPKGARCDRVAVEGGTVRVFRYGEGPPLLFLHPAAGAVSWNSFQEQLAAQHELIVPEHPGFGSSDDFVELRCMPGLAAHTRRVLDELGLELPTVVGASLGGWLAAELASRWPGSVRTLALLGAAGLLVPDAPYPDLFSLTPTETAALLFAGPPPPPSPGGAATAARNRAAARRFAGDPLLHNPALAARLVAITARCLVLHATEDRIVPLPVAQCYAAGIAGARAETVSGCGHAMYYERPDEFARAVLRFLAGA